MSASPISMHTPVVNCKPDIINNKNSEVTKNIRINKLRIVLKIKNKVMS